MRKKVYKKRSSFSREKQEQQETKCRNEEDLALMCGQKIRMVEAALRSRLLLSIHQITAHLRRQPRPHCLSHLKQLIQRVKISDCTKLANAFWVWLIEVLLKMDIVKSMNHIRWCVSGQSALPLSPLLFVSTSRKQLFLSWINNLLTMSDWETCEHCRHTQKEVHSLSLSLCDLQEGLWTVLFGHPLPLNLCRCGKPTSGAPEGGAAAIQVNVSVHRHLLLNNMRRHCRIDIKGYNHSQQHLAALEDIF